MVAEVGLSVEDTLTAVLGPGGDSVEGEASSALRGDHVVVVSPRRISQPVRKRDEMLDAPLFWAKREFAG